MNEKICKNCNELKPESEYYLKGKGKYLDNICKKCANKKSGIRQKIKSDAKKTIQTDTEHKCEKCEQTKPINMFYGYNSNICRSCYAIEKNMSKKNKITKILEEIREEKPALNINMSKHILFSKKLANALAEGLAKAFLVLADYIKEDI
jgi:hypothetical protein